MGWLVVAGICALAILGYRALTGQRVTTETRVECPICREAIRPVALRCPHCQADLMTGAVGRAMAIQRSKLLELARTQSRGNWLVASVLLGIIALCVIYIISLH